MSLYFKYLQFVTLGEGMNEKFSWFVYRYDVAVDIWGMLMNFCGLRKVYENFGKEDFLGSGLVYSVCNLSFVVAKCRMWDSQLMFSF